ncbi:site-specific integrase [Agrobacterium sp. El2ro-1b]|uniref:site-specific integrase n=1 Tax=Agrobacterium sp. El2ro-1b TaxID=2969528 RepID=UPI003AAA8906
MRYDEIRAALTRHFKDLLEKKKRDIAATGRLGSSDREKFIARQHEVQKAIDTNTPIPTNKTESELLDTFILKYQLNILPDSEQYRWLQRDIKPAFRSLITSVLAYDDSLDHFDLGQSIPITPVSSPAPRPSPKKTTVTLHDLSDRFIAERSLGNNWVPRTKLEKRDHIDLLKEIVGSSRDISSLTPQDVAQVKDTLTSLPKNRHKNKVTRHKPLAEVLKMANVERLQVASINKYLQTYGDLFEYALQHSFVEKNLFSGLSIKQNRQRSQNERGAFSLAQARLLINALTDPLPVLVKKPHQKWGPLIGLYTGARLNEIAQIDVADVRQESGIWLFDLNDEGEDKQLKTASSRRLVPVHAKLIEHGFLDYADAMRQQKKRKLFPDLPNTVEHGRGRNIGRWFNETLLPKLGIKDKGLVFHSLRHTVVTRLSRADVPESIIKAIVGHAQQGVTQQHYFKEGYTLRQLNDAIQKLDYSVQDGNE